MAPKVQEMYLKKRILFLIGSPNQTSQMHQIAAMLPEYDTYFSQIYTDQTIGRLILKTGFLDNTIMGGEFKKRADAYLEMHRLRNDYARTIYQHRYDMAVLCTDLYVPMELRQIKTVWVQEGMTDPLTKWGRFTRRIGLPAYFAMNTAFNGCSNIADVYCAASEGYKELFSSRGTDFSRIIVTGIPNYDHAATFLSNDFPHKDYVLAATSDIRETFNNEDRPAFIRKCVAIAGDRPLFFKLHPNEKKERAVAEINQWAPAARVFTEGNTEYMIANCCELITQYSTVVYIGIALGKKVHSYFDTDMLRKLAPIQNGGISASAIANICRRYIEFKGGRDEFLKKEMHEDRYSYSNQKRELEVAG